MRVDVGDVVRRDDEAAFGRDVLEPAPVALRHPHQQRPEQERHGAGRPTAAASCVRRQSRCHVLLVVRTPVDVAGLHLVHLAARCRAAGGEWDDIASMTTSSHPRTPGRAGHRLARRRPRQGHEPRQVAPGPRGRLGPRRPQCRHRHRHASRSPRGGRSRSPRARHERRGPVGPLACAWGARRRPTRAAGSTTPCPPVCVQPGRVLAWPPCSATSRRSTRHHCGRPSRPRGAPTSRSCPMRTGRGRCCAAAVASPRASGPTAPSRHEADGAVRLELPLPRLRTDVDDARSLSRARRLGLGPATRSRPRAPGIWLDQEHAGHRPPLRPRDPHRQRAARRRRRAAVRGTGLRRRAACACCVSVSASRSRSSTTSSSPCTSWASARGSPSADT